MNNYIIIKSKELLEMELLPYIDEIVQEHYKKYGIPFVVYAESGHQVTPKACFEFTIREDGIVFISGCIENLADAIIDVSTKLGKDRIKVEKLKTAIESFIKHEIRHFEQYTAALKVGADPVLMFNLSQQRFAYEKNPLELDAFNFQFGKESRSADELILGIIAKINSAA